MSNEELDRLREQAERGTWANPAEMLRLIAHCEQTLRECNALAWELQHARQEQSRAVDSEVRAVNLLGTLRREIEDFIQHQGRHSCMMPANLDAMSSMMKQVAERYRKTGR